MLPPSSVEVSSRVWAHKCVPIMNVVEYIIPDKGFQHRAYKTSTYNTQGLWNRHVKLKYKFLNGNVFSIINDCEPRYWVAFRSKYIEDNIVGLTYPPTHEVEYGNIEDVSIGLKTMSMWKIFEHTGRRRRHHVGMTIVTSITLFRSITMLCGSMNVENIWK